MKTFLLVASFAICSAKILTAQNPYVMVLGVAQDGGYPQAGCHKTCCSAVWKNKKLQKSVASIALVDPISKQKWIFDATPNFPEQIHFLEEKTKNKNITDGIFLTHAHIGHYTGLMHLGREVMGTKSTKVFAMPKMKAFLENNGPWSQLVKLKNIEVQEIEENAEVNLNERIKVVAFKVPHRDEFSETVGYKIITKNKSLIFIPDIDKWQKWNKDLRDLVKENDYLLLDGTFYKDGEIDRPMSEVPHPFVSETINLLSDLPINEKNKVHFIHLNHTNPLLQPNSLERKEMKKLGFDCAEIGEKMDL